MPLAKARPHRTRPAGRRRRDERWRALRLGEIPAPEAADALVELARGLLRDGSDIPKTVFMFKAGAQDAVDLEKDFEEGGLPWVLTGLRLGFGTWRPERYAFVVEVKVDAWDDPAECGDGSPDERARCVLVGVEERGGPREVRVHEVEGAPGRRRLGAARPDFADDARRKMPFFGLLDAPWSGLPPEIRVH